MSALTSPSFLSVWFAIAGLQTASSFEYTYAYNDSKEEAFSELQDHHSHRKTVWNEFWSSARCLCLQVQSGWPFLINADFLLTASRESIAFGTPWNQGLLGCARAAFVEGYLEIQVGRSSPTFEIEAKL